MARRQVKSAARVLDILELFVANGGTLGVSEIARKLSVPKSSAQGLLTTLATRNYLVRKGTSYYFPQELCAVGWIGSLRASLVTLAEPILHRITDECGESSFLGILIGNQVQYIAKAVSSREIRYDAPLSSLRPAYYSSTGLIILAHLDPIVANGILQRTRLIKVDSNTITDRSSINRMIERARSVGFAELRNSDPLNGSGVAAPVFGFNGEILAAVSIGAPGSRYMRARKQLVETAVTQAATISRLLLKKAKITKQSRTK